MPEKHEAASATLLQDGRVLVAGGYWYGYSDGPGEAAWLWDPATGSFTATGPLVTARAYHSGTLLQDGRVLMVAGVSNGHDLASAELWEPATGTFSQTGSLSHRYGQFHTAMRLPDGRVLVMGTWVADPEVGDTYAAEIWDPLTGAFSPVEWPGGRIGTATLLSDGRVLMIGDGVSGSTPDGSARVWDPVTGAVVPTGTPAETGWGRTATLLLDGRVLVAGGDGGPTGVPGAAEIWDPETGLFSPTGALSTPRVAHTATRLLDGEVLFIGGSEGDAGGGADVTTAELFQLK